MNSFIRYPLLLSTLIAVTACSNMPQLFWPTDAGGSKSSTWSGKAVTPAQARAPLELPPELKAEITLPMAKKVASDSGDAALPEKYTKAVVGKDVALDARAYVATADQVFSAVVDAMTSLNMPVEAVDSPSGVVTTDWVRKGSHNNNMFSGVLGQASNLTRHRFVVRVFRLTGTQKEKTRLEVRTLLQVFANKHWVSKPMNQKYTKEFFAAVEEQLARVQGNAAPLLTPTDP